LKPFQELIHKIKGNTCICFLLCWIMTRAVRPQELTLKNGTAYSQEWNCALTLETLAKVDATVQELFHMLMNH
jgi:hypothetical protein